MSRLALTLSFDLLAETLLLHQITWLITEIGAVEFGMVI
jgi:hypothetical protein